MRINLQYFGGRGSSSHRGGASRSHNGGGLAKLEGSPKQVKWANDIRKGMFERLQAFDKLGKSVVERYKKRKSLSDKEKGQLNRDANKLIHEGNLFRSISHVGPEHSKEDPRKGLGLAKPNANWFGSKEDFASYLDDAKYNSQSYNDHSYDGRTIKKLLQFAAKEVWPQSWRKLGPIPCGSV